jgi:hypothetical protein
MGKLLNRYRLIYIVKVKRDFIHLFIYFTLISWDIWFISLFTNNYFYDALLVYELKMFVKGSSLDLISFTIRVFDWSYAEINKLSLCG